jgi:hypothetical protein
VQYIIVNKHAPEQCASMEEGLAHLPDLLKGREFLCTCPFGDHGYFIVVEGDSAEDILKAMPESMRLGSTRALALEIYKL